MKNPQNEWKAGELMWLHERFWEGGGLLQRADILSDASKIILLRVLPKPYAPPTPAHFALMPQASPIDRPLCVCAHVNIKYSCIDDSDYMHVTCTCVWSLITP